MYNKEFLEKDSKINEKNLIKELQKIRKRLEFSNKETKQMLTVLIRNILNEKGKCYEK